MPDVHTQMAKQAMPNVIVRFPQNPPRRVRLKGEWWSLSIVPTRPKSYKHWALIASCEVDRREHVVCSGTGTVEAVREKMEKGFQVAGGTPLRGLVTELRRAGIVEFQAAGVHR